MQTLLDPLVISATPGQMTPILNLTIDSEDGRTPAVQANLLSLVVAAKRRKW